MSRKKFVQKFPFSFLEEYRSVQCIYRLIIGEHFFIGSTTALHKRSFVLSTEIERKIRLGCKDDDLLKNVVDHITSTSAEAFQVEVLFTVEKESELAAGLERMLSIAKHNPYCLNFHRSYDPHYFMWGAGVDPAAKGFDGYIPTLITKQADGEIVAEYEGRAGLPLPADFLQTERINMVPNGSERSNEVKGNANSSKDLPAPAHQLDQPGQVKSELPLFSSHAQQKTGKNKPAATSFLDKLKRINESHAANNPETGN